jgi:phage-related minor tail protein
MTPEELREYELSCSEAVDQPPTRADRVIAAQTMMIDALRDSLEEQSNLIEGLEADRDAWKEKERKCAASYYDREVEHEKLKTRYRALEQVKDDYLEANTALHQIINNVRRTIGL